MSALRATGAFGNRLSNAWVEIRENFGRSLFQALGVILGVASVLGGLSISDSQRKRSDELFIRLGGLDKLSIQPSPVAKDGTPSALQMPHLGLRANAAASGQELERRRVPSVATQTQVRAQLRA